MRYLGLIATKVLAQKTDKSHYLNVRYVVQPSLLVVFVDHATLVRRIYSPLRSLLAQSSMCCGRT